MVKKVLNLRRKEFKNTEKVSLLTEAHQRVQVERGLVPLVVVAAAHNLVHLHPHLPRLQRLLLVQPLVQTYERRLKV
jgi:hypothetical protein